jgi:hypothetical protein
MQHDNMDHSAAAITYCMMAATFICGSSIGEAAALLTSNFPRGTSLKLLNPSLHARGHMSDSVHADRTHSTFTSTHTKSGTMIIDT